MNAIAWGLLSYHSLRVFWRKAAVRRVTGRPKIRLVAVPRGGPEDTIARRLLAVTRSHLI